MYFKPDRAAMARAFNEWMRRYTDQPERYAREFQAVGKYLAEVAKGEEPTYGDEAAAFFEQLLEELDGDDSATPVPPTPRPVD